MTVKINQLKVNGTISNSNNKDSSISKKEIEQLIESKINKDSGSGIKETHKRQLIEECVREVLKVLEQKMSY